MPVLTDKRILLTRARQHYPALARMVERRGGMPLSLPCLALQEMPESIASGFSLLDECSDLLFTSASGVAAVAGWLEARGASLAEALRDKRIAVVGDKTATALQQRGVRADIVPVTASQDGLIDAYQRAGLPSGLLFFRAETGRDALAAALLKQGVRVMTVPAYRTVCPQDHDAAAVIAMLERGAIDAVLLGSARTAAHYLQRIGSLQLAARPVIVAISQSMAESVRALGLDVQVVAKQASFEAMLDALAEYFNSGSE